MEIKTCRTGAIYSGRESTEVTCAMFVDIKIKKKLNFLVLVLFAQGLGGVELQIECWILSGYNRRLPFQYGGGGHTSAVHRDTGVICKLYQDICIIIKSCSKHAYHHRQNQASKGNATMV